MTVAGEYKRLRRLGYRASNAYDMAKTNVAFDNLEFDEVVRIRVEPDEFFDLDNLLGDTYDPSVNTDIPPERLERERKAEINRINRDGVWGIVGEYFNGETWEVADSVWGFVGDDWQDSGYDVDIKQSTINAYRSVQYCVTCRRPVS